MNILHIEEQKRGRALINTKKGRTVEKHNETERRKRKLRSSFRFQTLLPWGEGKLKPPLQGKPGRQPLQQIDVVVGQKHTSYEC
jgi:hypothetical protein